MKFQYYETDPNGQEHYAIGEAGYDELIDALRRMHGEMCELLVRAVLSKDRTDNGWGNPQRVLAA
jgi:hypothetical protein